MNKDINITDAEWEVMKIIWDRSPITSNEIVKALKTDMQWQDSTVYTLIKRLVKKKMIAIEKDSSPYICKPLVSQRDCRRVERVSFIKKVYNGSLNLMLANMIEDEELTEKDIQDLKNILEKKSTRG